MKVHGFLKNQQKIPFQCQQILIAQHIKEDFVGNKNITLLEFGFGFGFGYYFDLRSYQFKKIILLPCLTRRVIFVVILLKTKQPFSTMKTLPRYMQQNSYAFNNNKKIML